MFLSYFELFSDLEFNKWLVLSFKGALGYSYSNILAFQCNFFRIGNGSYINYTSDDAFAIQWAIKFDLFLQLQGFFCSF